MPLLRFSFFMLLLQVSWHLQAQGDQTTILRGNIGYLKGKRMLDIQYRKLGGGYIFDSVQVNDGVFRVERKISEPMVAVISPKEPPGTPQRGTFDYANLFLMPGKELVLNAPVKLAEVSFTGTGVVENAAYRDYVRQVDDILIMGNQKRTELRRSRLTDSVGYELKLAALEDSINALQDGFNKQFFTRDPQSPVASYALLRYAGTPVWTPRKKMVPEEIEKYYQTMPRYTYAYPSMAGLYTELQVSKKTGPGKEIIDFTLTDTQGNKVKLSDFKGKYVFLDFWASWCAPCRKENPNVKAQYEKYKSKGFTVLSVSLDKPEARAAWLQAIEKDQISMFTHVSDLKGFDSEVARDYYVKSIPTNFLIGPDARFINRNLYGAELNKALQRIFADK